MVSWYRWALGPSYVSHGQFRYPGDVVDGEATVEFLIDADPDVIELGQGTSVITDSERASLRAGRYDEIVFHAAAEGVEQQQQIQEEQLQREEEAGYEAKREQARAARQAQSIEASRAAATAVAVAQATNLALRDNGDLFISAGASSSISPPTMHRTEGAASSDSSSATADSRQSEGVAPLKLNGLRSEPRLDPAKAQIQAFENSMKKGSGSTPPATKRAFDSTGRPMVMTASTTKIGVKKSPILHSNPRLMRREPPPLSEDEAVDGATAATSSHEEQLAQFEAAGFMAATEGVQSSVTAAENDTTSFSIIDDDDDDDFDSFLENVKAQAISANSGDATTGSLAANSNIASNLSIAADTIAIEDAEEAVLSPTSEVTVDEDDFTPFEDSVS